MSAAVRHPATPPSPHVLPRPDRPPAPSRSWESALLVKALAKRQRANIRFGSVRVITADAFAAPTARVYNRIFTDWRVLFNGGKCRGGRDDALDIQVVSIDSSDAALRRRASELDDAWFERGLSENASHPSWPVGSVADEPSDEPAAKRQAT